MEVAGNTLTPEGWNGMAQYFVRPQNQPNQRKLIVVKDFVVSKPIVKENAAELYVEYTYLGQLNSIFARYPEMIPGLPRGPIKVRVEYYLTRIPAEGGSRAVPVWKIEKSSEGPPERVHVNVPTAIAYLRQLQSSDSNPIIKRNAEKSIEVLREADN